MAAYQVCGLDFEGELLLLEILRKMVVSFWCRIISKKCRRRLVGCGTMNASIPSSPILKVAKHTLKVTFMMGGGCGSWTAAAEKKTQVRRNSTADEGGRKKRLRGQRCEEQTVDLVYAKDRLLTGRRFAVLWFGLAAFLMWRRSIA